MMQSLHYLCVAWLSGLILCGIPGRAVADEFDSLFGVEAVSESAVPATDAGAAEADEAVPAGDRPDGEAGDAPVANAVPDESDTNVAPDEATAEATTDGPTPSAETSAKAPAEGGEAAMTEAPAADEDLSITSPEDAFAVDSAKRADTPAPAAEPAPVVDEASLPPIADDEFASVEQGLDSLERSMLQRDAASSQEVTMLTALLAQREKELTTLRSEVAKLEVAQSNAVGTAVVAMSPESAPTTPSSPPLSPPDDSAYNRGCQLYEAGHYADAAAAFKQGLRVNPSDTACLYNLGILYSDYLARPDHARRCFERFLALAPDGRDAAQVREWLMTLK